MRFAALDNKLDNIDRHVENLRLDMQSAIHNEFMYLANKMLLLPKQQQQKNIIAIIAPTLFWTLLAYRLSTRCLVCEISRTKKAS
jgi:hypothetical protein